MATTISDLVDKTRSMVFGGSADTLNVLADDYVAGSGNLRLQYPNRGISNGSLLSVGLNTLYVLAANGDGSSFTVLPSADGGPDTNVISGTVVRCRPKVTTWAVFREIHDAIVDMASPKTGLFQALSFTSTVRHNSSTYPLPQDWWDDALGPQRLVRARYRETGTDNWLPLHSAEYQVERYAVRVVHEPENALQYEFTFGFPFYSPQALDDTCDDLGLTEKSQQDIPPLRAAARLSLGVEGRRTQPFAQGDSRRPEEVPITASLSVSREFDRQYREAVMAERSRLVGLFGFQTRIGDEA